MKNSNDLPMPYVQRIFMRLHGRFGNAFFDKFRINQLNEDGLDFGIENAKQEWSTGLAGVSPEQIKHGLARSFEYPPSLDEFKAACLTAPPEQLFNIALPKPAISDGKLEQNRKFLRLLANKIRRQDCDAKAIATQILADANDGIARTELEINFALRTLIGDKAEQDIHDFMQERGNLA
jgi:hypothetical protein